MAEAVLYPLASSALKQLTSPAFKEFLLLWNSKKELKRLEQTITIICLVLQDAESQQWTNPLVKEWLARLKEVMYEADDLFDVVTLRVLRKTAMSGNAFAKEVRLFFSKSNHLGFTITTAHKVKSIRESLDVIARDMGYFGFRQHLDVEKPVRLVHRQPTHSFILSKEVVGRDQEREGLIKMLLAESDHRQGNFHVVAVIGFGGLGKTTLAQLVYNDERVKASFDVCLWVCINYLSNLEQVLIDIISSVEAKPHDLGLERLQGKLRKIIDGRRFLIVLDDVWEENDHNWLGVKDLLCYGKGGSKVLVTTRSKKVAQALDASKPYCHLGVLSEEAAWSLFVKMAFKEGELSKHPELGPLGRQIVHRCGYVPLAIVTVGRLLHHREKEERVWLHFVDNELSEALSDDDDKKIMQVLMISYIYLPHQLKHCFAYCSLFPKDYKFDMHELIRLWLAQGFLEPSTPKQSLEEVGETYFFYLVDRCFFQEVEKIDKVLFLRGEASAHRYRYTARMHDLLHDLAVQVAGTESRFLHEVPNGMGQKEIDLRHISISFELERLFGYSSIVSDPKKLRTLIVSRFPQMQFNKNSLILVWESFRMLRTLHLSKLNLGNIPDSIGKLVYMRYLNLSYNRELKHLPNSICKLHHLMILELTDCESLENLPSDIGKLVSLRQLYLSGCGKLVSLPPGLTALTSLTNIDRIIVHREKGGLGCLNGLDNLSGVVTIELPIKGWANSVEDARNSNMSRKHKLDGLNIHWPRNSFAYERSYMMANDEAKMVMEALEPHRTVAYVHIQSFVGDIFPSWVCNHQHVKELRLSECHVEYVVDEKACNLSLPSLEMLVIYDLRNLKGWQRPETSRENDPISRRLSFPKLATFDVYCCLKLKEPMPLFENVENLVLSTVNVKLVKELLLNSVNRDCASKLKVLKLESIAGLTSLPEQWISHLNSLQTLTIASCHKLKRVSRRGLAHLTALQELEFLESTQPGFFDTDDEELERWGRGWMQWKALQTLRVFKCPITYGHFQEGLQYLTSLEILNVSFWKVAKETGVYGDTKGDEFPLSTLQQLRELNISFGGIRYRLPNGIQHLRSLEVLEISNCKELYLSWPALLLTGKLRELSFSMVKSVINVEDGVVIEKQSQLRFLSIRGEDHKLQHGLRRSEEKTYWSLLQWRASLGVSESSSPINGEECIYGEDQECISGEDQEYIFGENEEYRIQEEDNEQQKTWAHDIPWKLLGSLEDLRLYESEHLPEGIQHLTSLQELYIWESEKLRTLPNWMRNLTSLRYLDIRGCSQELAQRCEEASGADWPLIRHVPLRQISTRRWIYM